MVNSRNIDDLHPAVARGCRELIRRMNENGFAHVGVSSTFRDNAYQDHLFAQGRTRPGAIVTQARGGQSWHNWRVAFDIFQNIRGQEWNNPDFFAMAGRIWEGMGGEWGGSWVGFVDRPHFQFTGGLTLRDFQNGRTLPTATKMPWEDRIQEEMEEEMTQERFNQMMDTYLAGRAAIKEPSDWAVSEIAEAVAAGITDGERPHSLATRQEVIAMVYRAINR